MVEKLVVGGVVLVVAVVLVTSVLLPEVYNPVLDPTRTATNTTLVQLNQSAEVSRTLITSNLSANPTGDATLYLAWDAGFNGSTDNVTVRIGSTTIATPSSGTSPQSFTFAHSLLTDGQTNITFNTTDAAGVNHYNFTDMRISYFQPSDADAQGWSSAVQTLWSVVLAIVIIAALFLIAMRAF